MFWQAIDSGFSLIAKKVAADKGISLLFRNINVRYEKFKTSV